MMTLPSSGWKNWPHFCRGKMVVIDKKEMTIHCFHFEMNVTDMTFLVLNGISVVLYVRVFQHDEF